MNVVGVAASILLFALAIPLIGVCALRVVVYCRGSYGNEETLYGRVALWVKGFISLETAVLVAVTGTLLCVIVVMMLDH